MQCIAYLFTQVYGQVYVSQDRTVDNTPKQYVKESGYALTFAPCTALQFSSSMGSPFLDARMMLLFRWQSTKECGVSFFGDIDGMRRQKKTHTHIGQKRLEKSRLVYALSKSVWSKKNRSQNAETLLDIRLFPTDTRFMCCVFVSIHFNRRISCDWSDKRAHIPCEYNYNLHVCPNVSLRVSWCASQMSPPAASNSFRFRCRM